VKVNTYRLSVFTAVKLDSHKLRRYALIRWFNIEVVKLITLGYCLSHGTLCSGQHISLEIGNKLDVSNLSHNDGLK
jgi:hypothetical protein